MSHENVNENDSYLDSIDFENLNTQDSVYFQNQCFLFRKKSSDLFQQLFDIAEILWPIKQKKLYKYDPLYPDWNEFLKVRVQLYVPVLVASDFLIVLEAYLNNKDWMTKDGLKQLGYQKSVFLCLIINQVDSYQSRTLAKKWKKKITSFYKENFCELADIPFVVYRQAFWSRLPDLKGKVKEYSLKM